MSGNRQQPRGVTTWRAGTLCGAAVAVACLGCSAILGVGDLSGASDGGSDSGPSASGSDSGPIAHDGNAVADGADGDASMAPVTDAGADVFEGSANAPDGKGGTAVCRASETRCAGNGIASCDDAGQWGAVVPCPDSLANCVDGRCETPPSCALGGPGLTDCGGAGESCCTSSLVDGGTYFRTYVNSGTGVEPGAADPAAVSPFRLDRFDVTVGRFRRFVMALDGGSGWSPPAGAGKHAHLNSGRGLVDGNDGGAYEIGWDPSYASSVAPTSANLECDAGTWTETAGDQEDLPIDCVNWYEAYAFCIWDGAFLPSEAEWELAAAGGDEQRRYPWGNVEPGTANQYAIFDCDYPDGSGTCTGIENVAPVGSAPLGAGRWGQLDMAGEIWQWVLDWQGSSYADPCVDCASLTTADASTAYRVFRGGRYANPVDQLFPWHRTGWFPWERAAVGFRCARVP